MCLLLRPVLPVTRLSYPPHTLVRGKEVWQANVMTARCKARPHILFSLPNDYHAIHLNSREHLAHHVHSCLVSSVLVTLQKARQVMP